MTSEEQIKSVYSLANSNLQIVQAINRLVAKMEISGTITDRERQEVHDLRIAFENFMPEFRHEMRQIFSELAVLRDNTHVLHEDLTPKPFPLETISAAERAAQAERPPEGRLWWFLAWWGKQTTTSKALLIVFIMIIITLSVYAGVLHPLKVLE